MQHNYKTQSHDTIMMLDEPLSIEFLIGWNWTENVNGNISRCVFFHYKAVCVKENELSISMIAFKREKSLRDGKLFSLNKSIRDIV